MCRSRFLCPRWCAASWLLLLLALVVLYQSGDLGFFLMVVAAIATSGLVLAAVARRLKPPGRPEGGRGCNQVRH